MRVIDASKIGEAIESLCLDISTTLGDDVKSALEFFRSGERSELGRRVIDLIIENARVALEKGVPLCQDTGVFSVYVTVGAETLIKGDIEAIAASAVARATKRGALRSSIVNNPLDERDNTKDNTPAIVDVTISNDEKSTVGVLAKGGGCENASRIAMLSPGAGWKGVREFVLETISEVGAGSCPPLALGLGIGGSFDRAPALAKRALLLPLNSSSTSQSGQREKLSPAEGVAMREAELVEAVNCLGIGPGALGGTTTCIGARILSAPCHMACLPVALSVNCHSLRRKVIEI